MKVGDKKQAIALGIAALFALGMLGKTALGSLSKGGGNQPLVVKEVGGPAGKPDSSSQDQHPPASEPASRSSGDQVQVDNSTPIKRDAFNKPFVPEKTKPFEQANQPPKIGGESYSKTDENEPATVGGVVDGTASDPGTGMDPPLPKGEIDPNKVGESKPKQSPLPKVEVPSARYDGFVEAGSPMAVISFKGKHFSVNVGDSLGLGYTVESISGQKIRIRKGKVVKTILIGQETKI
jgi:hypothetical protein